MAPASVVREIMVNIGITVAGQVCIKRQGHGIGITSLVEWILLYGTFWVGLKNRFNSDYSNAQGCDLRDYADRFMSQQHTKGKGTKTQDQ